MSFLLCSNCFNDQGLRLDAEAIGEANNSVCPKCLSKDGKKLTAELIHQLTSRFFVWGTLHRTRYGGAPVLAFNEMQETTVSPSQWFKNDLHLIENAIGVGVFHYGPNLWMIGEVYPLEDLQKRRRRTSIIKRILNEYPSASLSEEQYFYRIRKSPAKPESASEYDSP